MSIKLPFWARGAGLGEGPMKAEREPLGAGGESGGKGGRAVGLLSLHGITTRV